MSFRIQTFSFPSQSTLNVFSLLFLQFLWFCERWRAFLFFFAIQSVYFCFLFKNWWHMHWVFVCVCDLDVNRADLSSCLLQTFDASSSALKSPNLCYLCLLGEYLNKKKKKCTSIFVHLCNEYLCICFVQLNKYICISSLVFPCVIFVLVGC